MRDFIRSASVARRCRGLGVDTYEAVDEVHVSVAPVVCLATEGMLKL